jgi:hypothetical protein
VYAAGARQRQEHTASWVYAVAPVEGSVGPIEAGMVKIGWTDDVGRRVQDLQHARLPHMGYTRGA